MLSPFGIEIRKHRIDRSLTLANMALGLEISTAHLSLIETGKRNIPNDLLLQVVSFLGLDSNDLEKLIRAAFKSQRSININVADLDIKKRELAGLFAAMLPHITPDQVTKINDALNN